jgi:uroporphyrinogen III methyltransferase/synthase
MKGRSALEICDVVVYDHLAALELVVGLPPRIGRRYVGKIAGKHSFSQDEINRLLLDLAQSGKKIARLKGGDPFVFGRGGEEAIFLRENGIEFEIIPGVTSGIAGPASARIPLTHRGVASYATLFTAHEAAEKLSSEIPWELFSLMSGGSLVGFMGVKTLSEVVNKLQKEGMSPETPIAIVERGTYADQRCLSGTLSDIVPKVKKADIKSPSLIVIGEAVKLRDKIAVGTPLPLRGKTIMVTRPGSQAGDLYRKIRALGGEPLPLPTIATEEHFEMSDWQKLNYIREGWLLFTSENGVRYFSERFLAMGGDWRRLSKFVIGAIGSGTAEALKRYGLKADFIPQKFTITDFIEELLRNFSWEGKEAVRVRGNLGDDSLEKALSEAGAEVFPLPVYRTFTDQWDKGMWTAFEEANIDEVIFTSASTVNGLAEILRADRMRELLNSAKVFSIGPSTSEALRKVGVSQVMEAKVNNIDGIIELILIS